MKQIYFILLTAVMTFPQLLLSQDKALDVEIVELKKDKKADIEKKIKVIDQNIKERYEKKENFEEKKKLINQKIKEKYEKRDDLKEKKEKELEKRAKIGGA